MHLDIPTHIGINSKTHMMEKIVDWTAVMMLWIIYFMFILLYIRCKPRREEKKAIVYYCRNCHKQTIYINGRCQDCDHPEYTLIDVK